MDTAWHVIQIALYIIEILVAIGLIILVHELGHFLSAKALGIHARKFALGMGPIIFKWGKGETEYSLRWIPVGGFVDLVGEQPQGEEATDPRGLFRRPAWQKVVVFSAGVTMNAVLALGLFTVAPLLGVKVPPAVVGDVVEGMPAEAAGLLPGDQVTTINGHHIDSFEDLFNDVGLASAGSTFTVTVERAVPGSDVPKVITVQLVSERGPEAPLPQIGIAPEFNTTISRIAPDAPLRKAGLEAGDRIMAVNGHPVENWRQLGLLLDGAPARQCALSIVRNEQEQDLAVDFDQVTSLDFGFELPWKITSVGPNSPAALAGIEADDRVAAAGDIAWPSTKAFRDYVKAHGSSGPIHLVLARGDKKVEVNCTPKVMPGEVTPRLGVRLGLLDETPVKVLALDPHGAAQEAGLRAGDEIVSTGEDYQPIESVDDLVVAMGQAGDKPLALHIRRGQEGKDIVVQARRVVQDHLSTAGAQGDLKYVALPRIVNPVTAVQRGLRTTTVWIARAYLNIKQLVTGQVSIKLATGPVGITQYAYTIASHGIGTLMEFMGMLSIFIAVLNFLPVPPFDGGHVLFTLIDKVKGKPVSLKTRSAFWIVGWVLVIMLFLFVTYRDILRVVTTWFGW